MIRTQITLGVLLMLVSVGAVIFLGAREEERMAVATESQLARRIENGAALFHNNCVRCHGEHAEGVPGLCPPLNSLTLLTARAEETGWTGSVHNWLVNTIEGGRLESTRPDEYVGESASGMAMPFWSQQYGGPLREDQIQDIAYFLQNFGETELVEEPGVERTPIAVDVEDSEAVIEAGVEIYAAQGCIGCHQLDVANANGQTGPTHNNLGVIAEQRIEDPNYTGEATTAEEYIRESIVNPGAYVVEGYQNIMPPYAAMPEDELNVLVQMLLLQRDE
jgi:mono/diheme cytochrome c family protein